MAPAAAAPADTLTVVTLNLWHDSHDWPKRLNVILAEMRRIRPDVLCLQEVLQNPQLPTRRETLADSLGCHLRFASVDGPERPKRYGNAVLTPHRVLADGERNLEPADDYRAVAHLRFDWRGRTVDAYSTHLHHTPEGGAIRATQIRHLLAYVDSTRGDGPLVIAGDFNAELGTPEMDLVTARYVDAFQAVHPKASAPRRRRSTPASASTRARSITSSSRRAGRGDSAGRRRGALPHRRPRQRVGLGSLRGDGEAARGEVTSARARIAQCAQCTYPGIGEFGELGVR